MKSDPESRRLPPIVFLVFNRPGLTAQVYERIRAARPERFFVVADGPRRTHPEDRDLCRETRGIVCSPDWPCELQVNLSDTNLGCRRRISSGLDWVFDQVEEAIVLEDDCVPNKSFFEFCSTLLNRFRDEKNVMSIGGSNFQMGHQRGIGSYYFSGITHIWGWATWRRAWRQIDIDLKGWPAVRDSRSLPTLVADKRWQAHWYETFEKTYRGEIDSWGFPWFFTCWCRNALTVVPNVNLVTNIGCGPEATHTKGKTDQLYMATRELDELVHPSQLSRNRAADDFLWRCHILRPLREQRRRNGLVARLRKAAAIRTRLNGLLQSLRRRP